MQTSKSTTLLLVWVLASLAAFSTAGSAAAAAPALHAASVSADIKSETGDSSSR